MDVNMGVINLICKSDYTFGDSLIVTILGMVLIFLVLAFLMGILYLLPIALNPFKKREPQKTQPNAQIGAPSANISQAESEEEEVAAAIIAAVTLMREKENINAPFVIRKIKRN